MDLTPYLPALAPLSEDQARSLLIYRETLLPHGPRSRPPRGSPDKLTRTEQRSQRALESLLSDIGPARERVYQVMNTLLRAGQLNRRALLDILYPPPQTPYAERLNDWAREGYLWFEKEGNPAPQPTAAILVQRELDPRKRKLPERRERPRSFFVWRWDTPDQPMFPYELPLVVQDMRGPYGIYKAQPIPGSGPSLLMTPWQGIVWEEDEGWFANERGAMRWLGEPTQNQLFQWLSPQQLTDIARDSTSQAELARLALPILADERLSHQKASRNASGSKA